MNNTYAADGVDVSAEEEWSKAAYALCKETFTASAFVEVRTSQDSHFRLGSGYQWNIEPSVMMLDAAADGLGTKPTITAAARRWEAAAHDLVAMVAHDLSREGGMLALLTTVVAVDGVGDVMSDKRAALTSMFTELTRLAREYHFVLYKGETAQVGEHIRCAENSSVPLAFMWEGVGHGVYDTRRRIHVEELRPGQVVVALREHGFRCNGISSVRRAFLRKFGAGWVSDEKAQSYLYEAAAPSVLYMHVINEALGWYDSTKHRMPVYAVSHITGGGIPGKFGEDILFRKGLSAELDALWEPPHIMQQCTAWRDMVPEECYRTWNGGQGMLVVVDAHDVDRPIVLAAAYDIEAKRCGEIVHRATPELVIHNKFDGGQKVLTYRPRSAVS